MSWAVALGLEIGVFALIAIALRSKCHIEQRGPISAGTWRWRYLTFIYVLEGTVTVVMIFGVTLVVIWFLVGRPDVVLVAQALGLDLARIGDDKLSDALVTGFLFLIASPLLIWAAGPVPLVLGLAGLIAFRQARDGVVSGRMRVGILRPCGCVESSEAPRRCLQHPRVWRIKDGEVQLEESAYQACGEKYTKLAISTAQALAERTASANERAVGFNDRGPGYTARVRVELSEESPGMCPVCEEVFTWNSEAMEHALRTAHGASGWPPECPGIPGR